MKEATNRKNWLITVTLAFIVIALCTLLFNGLTEAVAKAELKKTEAIPQSNEATSPVGDKNQVPPGYQRANYQVKDDPLVTEHPTSKDLSKEEAAELGAQMIWQLFGVDLQNATMYMGYSAGTETFPRAFWSGDIRFGASRTPQDPCYTFMVDAVTGERFEASWGRTLPVKVSLDYDPDLAKNHQEYLDKAQKLASQYNIVHGAVQATTYNCQGYSNNDPDITIDVLGVNGEKALLTFSRYDKQLTGVGYDPMQRIGQAALDKLTDKIESNVNLKRQEETMNESPTLQVLFES